MAQIDNEKPRKCHNQPVAPRGKADSHSYNQKNTTSWLLKEAKFGRLPLLEGERGGSVVECRTPEREVRGSRPTAAVLCP